MTPKLRRRLHLAFLAVWFFIGLPVSWVLKESVPWVVFLSVYAIIATHWAGYSAETPVEIEDDEKTD